METVSVYILALNQDWEMPVELAQSLTNLSTIQRKVHGNKPFYLDINREWYEKLPLEQQNKIKKSQRLN